MQRALALARNGNHSTSPNPRVGCVIEHQGRIIGEGWHQKAGLPHAEVVAFNSVKPEDRGLLNQSRVFVNLEPCSHYGRTPPCADLIIKHRPRQVVVANADPNPMVSGRGVRLLQEAGIDVVQGICEAEGRYLNRRFFCFHQNQRPYILLKWAQTSDGFIDKSREVGEKGSIAISSPLAQWHVHKWRSEVGAIVVGRLTAENDRPKLSNRLWFGNSPVPIVIDPERKLWDGPLFKAESGTYRFGIHSKPQPQESEVFEKDIDEDVWLSILNLAFEKQWLSIMVEGGAQTLKHLLERDLWDEARVLISPKYFGKGLEAPKWQQKPELVNHIGKDRLEVYFRR